MLHRFIQSCGIVFLFVFIGCGNGPDHGTDANPKATTLKDAVDMIDLRKFTPMEGAQRVDNTLSYAGFMLPKGDVNKAVEFYKTKLTADGWKLSTDPKFSTVINGGAQLFFSKNSHRLYAAMGTSPADGDLNVALFHLGNIDARKLPRFKDGEVLDANPQSVVVSTSAKFDAIKEFARAEFKKLGWIEYNEPMPKGMPALDEGDYPQLKFIQNAVSAEVVMMKVGDKNNIYTRINLLKHDLPILADAERVDLRDDPLYLFYYSETPAEKIAEFYQKEFAARGWKLSDAKAEMTDDEKAEAEKTIAEKGGDPPKSEIVRQIYECQGFEPLRFELLNLGKKSVIQITEQKREKK